MQIDSQEQIKKPKTAQEIESQDQKDLNKIKQSRKKCLIKLVLSIGIFIMVIVIGIVVFFIIKNKKK